MPPGAPREPPTWPGRDAAAAVVMERLRRCSHMHTALSKPPLHAGPGPDPPPPPRQPRDPHQRHPAASPRARRSEPRCQPSSPPRGAPAPPSARPWSCGACTTWAHPQPPAPPRPRPRAAPPRLHPTAPVHVSAAAHATHDVSSRRVAPPVPPVTLRARLPAEARPPSAARTYPAGRLRVAQRVEVVVLALKVDGVHVRVLRAAGRARSALSRAESIWGRQEGAGCRGEDVEGVWGRMVEVEGVGRCGRREP